MICFSYMPKGSRIRQFYLMIKILVLVWYINKKDVGPEYILLNLKLIDKFLMKQMQTSANK